MRHKRNTQTLSRFSSYYKATIRALARSVLVNHKIITTKLKAKLARRLVDKLVNLGKQMDSLAARRRANSFLNDHELVHKLFTQIGPAFTEKQGGYTRIIPFKRRRGDNAELVVLELSSVVTSLKPLKEKKEKDAPKVEDERIKMVTEQKKAEVRQAKQERKQEHKKESPKPPKQKFGGFGKFFKSERDSL